ncbi:acyltransferase [Winogradskyella sp. SYSU M77433]|uniref:acyltransferase n=1 Tax=Winogradskyella sp. SYSU M77433 TaxID=3042722 RepID=UPI0024804F3D|nr:acyltransferase [Winogradskyella sp. SYSU M77433]MDH7911517.1 acyltransferase [Winogradskyella sp. SYSU M77433]
MIFSYAKYLKEKVLRKLFWFYKLNNISFGKSPKITFPIKVEGQGKINIGNNAVLGRMTNFGIGKSAKLTIGNKCITEDDATIIIDTNFSLVTGQNFKLGRNARLYVKSDWVIGDNVSIETYCSIFAREPEKSGKLVIGNDTNIGDYTIIDLVDDVIIGDTVAIGPNSTLYTHDHIYSDKNVAAWKGGLIKKPIRICDGAWVGSGVTILPGVTIGERCIIAAGSVVTKSTQPNAIYGGVPAKLIKNI